MSNKPNPVALTAAMLLAAQYNWATREWRAQVSPYSVAQLASAIHRLAPACKRLAEAECNGEWVAGQRCHPGRHFTAEQAAKHNAEIAQYTADYAVRLDKRIAKLNAQLQPFGYQLVRDGDPRGATLTMGQPGAQPGGPGWHTIG